MAERRGEVDERISTTGETVEADAATLASGDPPHAATGDGAAGERGSPIAPGTQIDRYVVTGELGRGGMGIVLAARDPDLQRTVAIKLLRPRSTVVSEEMRQRLVREGQAIAQLSHPNVVQIYDVGMHGAEVFIAMELVEGASLARWLATPRSRRAIVDVFVQAGRGLVAAHGKGIIHRDFKPENVRVGDDGRVRVLDFGLARGSGAIEPPGANDADASPLTETMTGHGAIMGTPAYMAPEQFRGERADELADQFAFAVALHEALCGERPFTGKTLDELGAAVLAGRRRPMPRAAKVPAWLERAIARALAPAPGDRYTSLAAMLAVIERDPAAVRRRWAIGGAAVAVIGVAAIAVAATGGEAVPGPRLEPRLEPVMRQIVREEGVHLHPSFTPDATRFVHSNGTDLVVRGIDGVVIANLTADFAPRATEPELSSDGTRIAFVADGVIHTIGIDGGEPRRVTEGFWPTWSPDGAQLAFVTADVFDLYVRVDRVGGELWRVELATGTRRRVLADVEDAMQPDWSPDGSRIAFVAGARLAIARADGSDVRTSSIGNAWHPVWDPGGATVYAARERGGQYEIAAYPIDGGGAIDEAAVRPVTALSPAPVWHFDVARDARRFIAAVYFSEHRSYRVPFDPVAGKATGLPQPFGDSYRGLISPAVSPDGAQIAFASLTEIDESLYVMPVAGGDGRVIAGGFGYLREPTWKPDGTAITYRGTVDGDWGIRSITPDGKTTAVLYDDSGYRFARWAPDGRRLAITGATGPGGLDNHPFVVNVDEPWDAQTEVQAPALAGWRNGPWSPDGTRIAVFSRGGVGWIDPAADPAARVVTVVAERGQDAVWLADGKRMVVAAEDELVVVDLDARTTTPVVSLAPGRATELPSLDATPARDAIFVSTTIDHASLWLVDLKPAVRAN